MRAVLWVALALGMAGEAAAQTQSWSTAPRTGVWSSAPGTGTWSSPPSGPAPGAGSQGRTQPWATAPTTRRRSDAEIQQQVDGIFRDAERRAKGAGARAGGPQGSDVPDAAWRSHMDRTRAAEQLRRDQESHDARQRYHRGN